MEDELGAVKEAEIAPVESAPIETVETQNEPADAIIEPEKKVSDSVPYERFKEVNDRLRMLEAAQVSTDYVPPVGMMANETPFDQETTQNLDQWYERRRENERAQEFVQKHADDLKDPFVAARTQQIIREINATGQKADQSAALAQAKSELASRFTPIATQAKAQGEQEGLDIANKKELLSAVGNTASKQQLDETKLSSKEYAEFHGLKYVQ